MLTPARQDSRRRSRKRRRRRREFVAAFMEKFKAAALTGVPHVVTCRPRKWTFEGVDQVEDGPGQHHDVVDVQVGHDHLRSHSDPCRKQSHTSSSIY